MHRIIGGGTGLIGKRLVEHWLQQNHMITVIGRSEKRIKKAFGDRVNALVWNHLTADILQSAEIIVNLAGENISRKRWSEKQKKEIITSRVGSTKMITQLMAKLGDRSPRLLNASAVGIYGLQQQNPNGLPPQLDENASIDWDAPKDFVSQVCVRWEKAAEPAIAKGIPVVFMRFGLVLAKEGGALPLLMRSFRYYLGGIIGTGQQPMSWVSIGDVLRAIDFLVENKDASGAFNIVSPKSVTQREFAETLAGVMSRPVLLRIPSFVITFIFGEMGRELLLEGQNAYPAHLESSGFRFSYRELESAFNRILEESY